mmetsp:Transcript_75028/g.217778  ORF Transcript_75028/g.217778 Transcript_75028/m.217778 type:complete len:344 (-) Transcript_75028:199-1230(-)
MVLPLGELASAAQPKHRRMGRPLRMEELCRDTQVPQRRARLGRSGLEIGPAAWAGKSGGERDVPLPDDRVSHEHRLLGLPSRGHRLQQVLAVDACRASGEGARRLRQHVDGGLGASGCPRQGLPAIFGAHRAPMGRCARLAFLPTWLQRRRPPTAGVGRSQPQGRDAAVQRRSVSAEVVELLLWEARAGDEAAEPHVGGGQSMEHHVAVWDVVHRRARCRRRRQHILLGDLPENGRRVRHQLVGQPRRRAPREVVGVAGRGHRGARPAGRPVGPGGVVGSPMGSQPLAPRLRAEVDSGRRIRGWPGHSKARDLGAGPRGGREGAGRRGPDEVGDHTRDRRHIG